MTKINSGWKPTMEQRAEREDRQVKCLIASGGHMWMRSCFDRLPSAVRRRLANSRHNICAACMTEDAERVAATRGLRRPTVAIFFDVITAIERQLRDSKS
jgi:hypothetical protein